MGCLALLEDSESWSATLAFVSTISHVVEAASSLENLLELNPNAQYVPLFLGYTYFKFYYLRISMGYETSNSTCSWPALGIIAIAYFWLTSAVLSGLCCTG